MTGLMKVYQIVATIETFDGDKDKGTINVGTDMDADLKVALEKFEYETAKMNQKVKIKNISIESVNVIAEKVYI